MVTGDADGVIRPAVDDGGRAVRIVLGVACDVGAFHKAADLLHLIFQRGDRLVKLGRLDGDGGGIDDLRGIVGNGIVRLGRFGGAAARLRRGDGVVGEFLRLGGLFHGHFRGGSLRFGIVGCAGGLWGGVCRHGVGACRAAGENGQGQQGGEKDGKDRSLFHVEFPFLMCFCFYRRIFAQLVAGNGKFF